jgi:MraZ protein
MFLGQYTHSLDSKGRITVPARFREALSSGAFIVQGFERNLMVYTTESFKVLAKKATSLSASNPEARVMKRVLFGRATEVSLDSAGRFLIPPFLRKYARMDNEATLVGVGEYFEIWDSEIWTRELVNITDPELNAQRFTDFDISTG